MKRRKNGRLLLIIIIGSFYNTSIIAKTVNEIIRIPPVKIYERKVIESLEKEGIIQRSQKETYHISSYYRKFIKPLRSFPQYKLMGINILLCKYDSEGNRIIMFDHMCKKFKNIVGPQCQEKIK